MTTLQPIKRHGGKHYLAKRIVDLFPPRVKNPNKPAADDPGYVHYVEPFFGAGAVLFANDPVGISEVVNDIDWQLSCFWKVIRNEEMFKVFRQIVSSTPCSQSEYESAVEILDWCQRQQGHHAGHISHSRPALAAAFFIRNRQSRQALGKDFATITRSRTRCGMNELPSAWWGAIEDLPLVYERMKRVVVLNTDALKVIKQQDGPRTLYYLDPPYIRETRHNGGGEYGAHEMSVADHADLLTLLRDIKGRFLLSGYRTVMYDEAANWYGWTRHEFQIVNNASGKKTKDVKVECVWTNY